ncbi:MAG: P-loop NTPase, partial [Pirellula sp.]|nr:P-loop NTPase [Pirellula sp.]
NPSQEPPHSNLIRGSSNTVIPALRGMGTSLVERPQQRTNYVASYLEIPFMYKTMILGFVLLGVMLAWLLILVLPRGYESQAKLMVRVGRESVSLDPSATTSATLMLQKTQEEEVISALEVLGSRRIADLVTEKLGANAIIEGVLPKEGAGTEEKSSLFRDIAKQGSDWLWNVLWATGIKDDISDHELAVMVLQKTLSIHSPKRSTVIVVDATSKTPEMAQAIVRTATETFMEEHLKVSRVDGSFTFFEKQTMEAESLLNELVAKRAKFMQDRQMVSIEAGKELLQQQLSGIDRDLVVATGELEQAKSEIEDLGSKVKDTDDEVVAAKVAGSDTTWSGMRQQVYELELQEQNLAAQLTADHPKLIQIREQLSGAREILGNLRSERVDENKTPNPVKTALYQELQRQETKLVGLNSIIETKQSQKTEMENQIERLLEDERSLTQMDRDIRVLETKFQVMREKLEEARVIEGLQEQKVSNIHIFQPASFVERAATPNKKLLAAGCLFFGVFAGLSLCFVRQGLSPTLRTAEQIESRLGCNVVAQIPNFGKANSAPLNEHFIFSRSCQGVVSEILLSPKSNQKRGRTVGILSVDAGAGASTLAANLAMSSGVDCRMKTVLVDADARNRSISRMFWLNSSPGLFELVHGHACHEECLQGVNGTPISLLPVSRDAQQGDFSASPEEISGALQPYLNDFDLVVVDLPPASLPDQAVALAQHLDCVVIVIESERTSAEAAMRLIRRMNESNAKIIGVVLNKTRSYLPSWIRRFVAPQN